LRLRFRETSTDSHFELYKEKEMPEFRKWIMALAGVALFTGLASAQVGTPVIGGGPTGAFTCSTTNGSVTPTLRAEGYTEQVGDIVIICTGGTPPAIGTVIPTANFTVFLSQPVTSRLINNSSPNPSNASEALLIVDEPGSGEPGVGPTAPQTVCSSAAQGAGVNGCSELVGPLGTPVAASNPAAAGANIFQGLVTGNQVVFNGIPVLPPVTAGDTRVYRITNIRTNANGASAGGALGSITASLSLNSANSLLLNNSFLTVGYVTPGLSASFNKPGGGSSSGTSLAQCTSASVTSTTSTSGALGLLTFQSNFATAFKVRGAPNQNIPGMIFNTESGFTVGAPLVGTLNSGQPTQAGLADYGTRLKATFNNVPAGVTLYVSTHDIVNDFAVGPVPNFPNNQAVLVLGETAIDGGYTVSGNANTASTIGVAATQTQLYGFGGTVPLAPVAVNSGTGTGEAVWEVINANPSATATINFGLYISYTANPAANSPAAGTMSVTFSYAPTPSGAGVGFTSTTGSEASNLAPGSYTIPRFSDSLDITKTVAVISPCTTALLFPYLTNVDGLDTGLAIANTSSDNLGNAGASTVTAQAGSCSLWFYGPSAPTTAFTTASIPAGQDWTGLVSVIAPGFGGTTAGVGGYMIANCNFQYAHGFAFISDVGLRQLAMGYLALVLTRAGTSPENLNN
jgi:hypothetical protein